jgi:hypothetical protein
VHNWTMAVRLGWTLLGVALLGGARGSLTRSTRCKRMACVSDEEWSRAC